MTAYFAQPSAEEVSKAAHQHFIDHFTGDFVVIQGNVQAEPNRIDFPEAVLNHQTLLAVDKIFTDAWKRIHRSVKFNPQWKNGTSYLDHMVEESKGVHIRITLDETKTGPDQIYIVPGEQVKGVDDAGRRFILTGTRLGGIVVFDRYTLGSSPHAVFVVNRSRDLILVPGIPNGALTSEEMRDIVGSVEVLNIGSRIEAIWKASLKNTVKILEE